MERKGKSFHRTRISLKCLWAFVVCDHMPCVRLLQLQLSWCRPYPAFICTVPEIFLLWHLKIDSVSFFWGHLTLWLNSSETRNLLNRSLEITHSFDWLERRVQFIPRHSPALTWSSPSYLSGTGQTSSPWITNGRRHLRSFQVILHFNDLRSWPAFSNLLEIEILVQIFSATPSSQNSADNSDLFIC